MKRSLRTILLILGALGVAIFGCSSLYVGVPFLNNIHLSTLRFLGTRSLVKITNSTGAGATGFIIKGKSGKRIILTNGHVCGLAEKNQLFVHYRGDIYVLPVLKQYQRNDLCAVEAPKFSSGGFKLADSVEYGESVYAIGHPLLEPMSTTVGELSGLVEINIPVKYNTTEDDCKGETYHLEEAPEFFRMLGIQNACVRTLSCNAATISILPGNSGSPVVNIYGNLIGVAFAANEYGTRSYIVPLQDVKTFLEGL